MECPIPSLIQTVKNTPFFEAMNLINIAAALALASTVCGAVIPEGALGSTMGSVSKIEHTVASLPVITMDKLRT